MALARLFALACAFGSLSCNAELETGCRDGECSSGATDTPQTTTGTGATGGGGAEPFVCTKPNTFGLPCDVYSVLDDICQNCHFEGTMIAPFKLETYEDTQEEFFGLLKWERMRNATADTDPPPVPAMPQGNHPLPKPRLDALTAWFATCEAGECAMGEGIGAGGSGGTGSGATGAGGTGSGGTGSGGTGAGGAGGI